jgi:HJR/Mrr/RecB family endonuclease
MSRKKKNNVLGVLGIIIACTVGLATWIQDKVGVPEFITYTVMGLLLGLCLWVYFTVQNQKFRAIRMANVDAMEGVEFERYLQKLLSSQGYTVSMTRASGDLGVDLVAVRGADRVAIQAKRHKCKVSRRAISDAVAGMQHYRCTRAMVITNNHFTPGAVTLARSTNCTLVDRETLAQWIIQMQSGHESEGERLSI